MEPAAPAIDAAAAGESPTGPAVAGRNIVVFSDGTGQRGGVFFDETRTNIYKLYRAARSAPDTAIPPDRQLAFYDPGLGTQPEGGSFTGPWRMVYNYLSQATGLGLTHNIIDCYAAIIRLWRPGDRIFLFGFSRGAYTVRCLAAALCYCGIPTRNGPGGELKRDEASSHELASEAVKRVYQHVSSPRDVQFFGQRQALAARYRERHACAEGPDSFPFFIGVFDTVAALSNYGSLAVLAGLYAALVAAITYGVGLLGHDRASWALGLIFASLCIAGAAYVYTHLKFAFGLPGHHWWETVHLTTFRQTFYDQSLDDRVGYARHAISIDERRADFKRVRWNEPYEIFRAGMERFEQVWFAGNHADIGGGYPENEARLSDIALQWMVDAAATKLGREGLLVDPSVLQLHSAADGMQHDETRSLLFRLAGTSDRDPVPEAPLHPTVVTRFDLPGVLQYDVVAPYRPEALRGHHLFSPAYDNIPLPHQTCWQRIKASRKAWRHAHCDHPLRDRLVTLLKEAHMDRIVSCLALLFLIVAVASGVAILGAQVVGWLQSSAWPPVPLERAVGFIRHAGAGWAGLQQLYDWLLALPLSIVCIIVGFIVFWIGGVISAHLYRRAAIAQDKTVTPAQTQA
ncbi:DUF2235 domain-containing protein [Bradyrhizobium sp. WD16]|uniref:T6SS phospholipase effector Tle1-like catalytic domain-containing protein n=1 Tax=Bradyrhizobium sp. WD16 TaxID=1521768 RepID=UPI0020A2EB53|nr:DUF2235 domain-containing protein [Bradyrhizobium sp. WD16]UTD25545.1 DUF2235 domain-containing protein [Bradyrhizobium sp. WD16]